MSLAAALVLLLSADPAPEPGRTTLSTNAVGFAMGAVNANLEAERRLREDLTAYASVEYLLRANPLQLLAFTADGLVLTLGARWYPGRRAPAGWFLAPRLQLASVFAQGTPTGGATGAGLGFEGGYAWVLWRWGLLSIGAGANGYWLSAHAATGEHRSLFLALPSARLQVGVALP